MKVEIRVDGGPAVGMGHVVRCLALARALNGECRFLMRYSLPAVRLVREAGLPVLLLPEEDANAAATLWVAAAEPDLFVVDLFDVPVPDRETLAGVDCHTATLADLCDVDLPGDLLFNGFVGFGRHQVQPTSHGGMAYLGTDYKLVRARPPQAEKEIAETARRIVITAGGGDASGLSTKCLLALAQVDLPLEVTILEGPAMDVESDAYREALAACPHAVERHRTVEPFDLLAAADLALSAGGDTVYELAVLGVPTLILCHVEHQLETGAAFQREGAAECLGLVSACEEARLAEAILSLACDGGRRRAFSRRGQELVDGGGLSRVAELIRRLCAGT